MVHRGTAGRQNRSQGSVDSSTLADSSGVDNSSTVADDSTMTDYDAMRKSLDADRVKIAAARRALVLKAAAYLDLGLPLSDVLVALEVGRSKWYELLREARER